MEVVAVGAKRKRDGETPHSACGGVSPKRRRVEMEGDSARCIRFVAGSKAHDGTSPLHLQFDRLVVDIFGGRLGVAVPIPIRECPPLKDGFTAPSSASPLSRILRELDVTALRATRVHVASVIPPSPVPGRGGGGYRSLRSPSLPLNGVYPTDDEDEDECDEECAGWKECPTGRVFPSFFRALSRPTPAHPASQPTSQPSTPGLSTALAAFRVGGGVDDTMSCSGGSGGEGSGGCDEKAPSPASETFCPVSFPHARSCMPDYVHVVNHGHGSPASSSSSSVVSGSVHTPSLSTSCGDALDSPLLTATSVCIVHNEHVLTALSSLASLSESEVDACRPGALHAAVEALRPGFGGHARVTSVGRAGVGASEFAQPPPPPIVPAVRHVFNAYAGGDRLVLRGLLALTEDLEARLAKALTVASPEACVGAEEEDEDEEDEDECDEDEDADAPEQSPLGDEQGAFAASLAPVIDPLDALILSPAAAAAASSYKARRKQPTVPLLPGGGGSSIKLSPGLHSTYVRALTLLLRHAALAYPVQAPADQDEEDEEERSPSRFIDF